MGQALYRSHRPKTLAEIVGQEHISTALDHALKQGTISHAYLFTGPRGVGKTSIARILAHEINGLPYDEDARMHLDIIEIDAASNRRIDEIRDLRDKVHIAPSSAKFKVYIIDEVHMLTKEAFNALLKTLEEPPAHVVFILATTEVHKLPETIISRTQRYAFKPVDMPKVIAHLKAIAKKEKIEIDDDALALIAAHGEGSFRDSISLLDQVRNRAGKVTLADVQATLGIAPEELIATTLLSLNTHNALGVAESLRTMHDQGYEPAQVAKQLGQALRQALLDGKSQLPHEESLKLLSALVQVPASPSPRISLEIALLDAALAGTPAPAPVAAKAAAPASAPKAVTKPAAAKPAMAAPVDAPPTPTVEVTPVREKPVAAPATPAAAAAPALDATPTAATTDDVIDDNIWHEVKLAIKKRHNTLYSLINACQTHFEPGKVTLETGHAFHQKQLNQVKNKDTILVIIRSVTGLDLQIACILGKGRDMSAINEPAVLPPADGEIVFNAEATPTAITQKPTAESLDAISNIFGGAELLES
jgi:DNA polymerase-3 subunit gamma/tau